MGYIDCQKVALDQAIDYVDAVVYKDIQLSETSAFMPKRWTGNYITTGIVQALSVMPYCTGGMEAMHCWR